MIRKMIEKVRIVVFTGLVLTLLCGCGNLPAAENGGGAVPDAGIPDPLTSPMYYSPKDYTRDQYLILSQLSYIDMEKAGSPATIIEINDYFQSNAGEVTDGGGGLSRAQMLEILSVAANDPALRDLRLVAYTNQNVSEEAEDGSGLVGYVFETRGGDRVFAFRGSEGPMASNEDWRDNFGLIDGDSRQNREAIAFAETNMAGPPAKNYATGYSLGGSNAIAAAGALGMGGAVFNARGVAPDVVSDYGGDRFQSNIGENGFYSVRAEGDVVSSIDLFAWRPENEETVEVGAFYDENGVLIQPVPPELVEKVHAFYDEFEEFALNNPAVRDIVIDIIFNDLAGGVRGGDVPSMIRAMGYSVRILPQLREINDLRGRHSEALQYLTAAQDGASHPNIFTPHYSQPLQDPNRGNGTARYIKFAH